MRINRQFGILTVIAILVVSLCGWMIYQDGVRGALNVFSGGLIGLLIRQHYRHCAHIARLQARLGLLAPYEDAMNSISVQQQRSAPEPDPPAACTIPHTANLGELFRDTLAETQPQAMMREFRNCGGNTNTMVAAIGIWREAGNITENTASRMLDYVDRAIAPGGEVITLNELREVIRSLILNDGSPQVLPLQPIFPQDPKTVKRERSVQL